MSRLRRAGRVLVAAGVAIVALAAVLVLLNVLATLFRIVQFVALAAVLVGLAYVAYELYRGWTHSGADPKSEVETAPGDERTSADRRSEAAARREIDEELDEITREVREREADGEREREPE